MTMSSEWKEQAALERRGWLAKCARIRRAGAEHPDMPLCLLAERFGEPESAIRRVLAAAGIRREPDYIADSHNKVRKAAQR